MVRVLSGLLQNKIKPNNNYEPTVTVIIAAYNEEAHIGETVENKLFLKYPKDKLDIIIVSDESTDLTDDIAQKYVDKYPQQVKLYRQSPRNGKTSALNDAVPKARGDIIVFSDANSIYDSNALEIMVKNFGDPCVGYVSGKMIYINKDGTLIGDGCSSYMRYENFLRKHETNIGSIVGVDGGIDAVRKNLYRQMRADQIPDFILPLNVVEQDYRVIYEPGAILKEESLDKSSDEYRMRVRVSLRSMWAIWDKKILLNPMKYGIFSWQFFSHKLLRYTAFIPLVVAFITGLILISENLFYQVSMYGQILFYVIALVGYFLKGWTKIPAWVALPYYFCLLNIAATHAFYKFLMRKKQIIWNPRVG